MPQSFETATALTLAEGGYTTTLDAGWDVGGGVLNGGSLVAGESTYAVPVPAATAVEDCFSVAEHASLAPAGVSVPGISQQLETRLDPLTAGWVLGEPSGEPVIRAWVRFADGREPDPLGLVAFADALPPTS